MTALREYTEHWFEHTALRIGRPHWLELSAQWIHDVSNARPGFDVELREVALAALNDSRREHVHRALAALAVVGVPQDLSVIEPVMRSTDPYIAGAASTAHFEISHRAV